MNNGGQAVQTALGLRLRASQRFDRCIVIVQLGVDPKNHLDDVRLGSMRHSRHVYEGHNVHFLASSMIRVKKFYSTN